MVELVVDFKEVEEHILKIFTLKLQKCNRVLGYDE